MSGFANSPVSYAKDKKYITPRHLFTNTWREGFIDKMVERGCYDPTKTFNWKGR